MTAAADRLLDLPVAGLVLTSIDEANQLLVEWEHYLGPCERPFGQQAWTLDVDGRPVAVAVTASTVGATACGYRRGQVAELARICSAERWATRVMLRLWREVAAHKWPHWPLTAAIAYSQNGRHDGSLYRFDGWTKYTDQAGSSGGGTWSRKRQEGDPELGPKTAWFYPYADRA